MYDISYIWILKSNDTNGLIYKTETDSVLDNELTNAKGRMGGRGSLGVWDWHVHTAIFKMDNHQGLTV